MIDRVGGFELHPVMLLYNGMTSYIIPCHGSSFLIGLRGFAHAQCGCFGRSSHAKLRFA
jgi:hypothetical protein